MGGARWAGVQSGESVLGWVTLPESRQGWPEGLERKKKTQNACRSAYISRPNEQTKKTQNARRSAYVSLTPATLGQLTFTAFHAAIKCAKKRLRLWGKCNFFRITNYRYLSAFVPQRHNAGDRSPLPSRHDAGDPHRLAGLMTRAPVSAVSTSPPFVIVIS